MRRRAAWHLWHDASLVFHAYEGWSPQVVRGPYTSTALVLCFCDGSGEPGIICGRPRCHEETTRLLRCAVSLRSEKFHCTYVRALQHPWKPALTAMGISRGGPLDQQGLEIPTYSGAPGIRSSVTSCVSNLSTKSPLMFITASNPNHSQIS